MRTFKTLIMTSAGLALALMTTPSAAQMAPGSTAASGPPQQMPIIGRSLEDRVLVRGGTPEEISRLSRPPRAARYLARDDEHTELTRSEWRSRGWSEQSFDRIRQENYGLCVRTTVYILRVEELAGRYESRIPQIQAIAGRYLALGNDIRNAGRAQIGANILATIIGLAAVSTTYGAIVGAGAVGSIAQGAAWTESMVVNRDAGLLTTVLMRDHVGFNLLALDVYSDYLSLVSDYCNEFLGQIPAAGYGANTRIGGYEEARGTINILPSGVYDDR